MKTGQVSLDTTYIANVLINYNYVQQEGCMNTRQVSLGVQIQLIS